MNSLSACPEGCSCAPGGCGSVGSQEGKMGGGDEMLCWQAGTCEVAGSEQAQWQTALVPGLPFVSWETQLGEKRDF